MRSGQVALPGHPVWNRIAPEFVPAEFKHSALMDTGFLEWLHGVRLASGVPFRVVSSYRSPEANESAGGASRSAHTDIPCCAVDLRVHNSSERHAILRAAYAAGASRVGVYPPTRYQVQKWGKNSGSIHLDLAPGRPEEVTWVSV